MKYEVPVIKERYQQERDYYLRARRNNSIILNKEFFLKKLAPLPYFERNCDSVALYNSVNFF